MAFSSNPSRTIHGYTFITESVDVPATTLRELIAAMKAIRSIVGDSSDFPCLCNGELHTDCRIRKVLEDSPVLKDFRITGGGMSGAKD